MINHIVPVSVVLCGVLGLAVVCLAILRMAILERRRHLDRRPLQRPVEGSQQAPQAGGRLAA